MEIIPIKSYKGRRAMHVVQFCGNAEKAHNTNENIRLIKW